MKLRKVESIAVSPDTAKKWLEKKGKNCRPGSVGNANYYSKVMIRGEWVQDADDCIMFDCEGFLRNGQNRLAAVIASNTTQIFRVSWNTPEDVIASTDQGVTRKAAAVCEHLLPELSYRARAAALAIVKQLLQRQEGNSKGQCRRFTQTEYESVVRQHDSHLCFLAPHFCTARNAGLSRKEIGLAFLEFLHTDPDKAREFISDYFVTAGHIQQAQYLSSQSLRNKGIHSARTREKLYGFAIYACRAFQAGRDVKQIVEATWTSVLFSKE